jgi:ribonuclease P protein component
MKRSLTRRERLSGKREIAALFAKAARVESNGVKLLFRPNQLDYNRVLITVRRGFATAVARNRQKRILREIYRISQSGLKPGFDLAFILLREESTFDELRAAYARLVRQARLMSSPEV